MGTEKSGEERIIERLVEVAGKRIAKEAPKAPEGLTFKEERFCQLYVKYGCDSRRAFVEAKLLGNPDKAILELIKRDDIQRRIETLQETLALKNNLTPEKVVEMILTVYRSSLEAGKYDQANRSAELLGKYLGMFVDKSEMKQTVVTDEAKLDDDIKRFAKIAGVELKKVVQ